MNILIDHVIDAKGNTTWYGYDNNYNLTSVTTPEENIYQYTYDYRNNVKSFIDGRGNITEYDYDNNENLEVVTYADGSTQTYEYDALNRMTGVFDGLGYYTEYRYKRTREKGKCIVFNNI